MLLILNCYKLEVKWWYRVFKSYLYWVWNVLYNFAKEICFFNFVLFRLIMIFIYKFGECVSWEVRN